MKKAFSGPLWYHARMKKQRKKITACLAVTMFLSGCAAQAESGVPYEAPAPEARNVIGTIEVTADSGTEIPVELSDNEVPDAYYEEAEQQGTIEKFRYDTSTYGRLGEERDMEKYAEVYLPYGYDETKQYDIVYMMHGRGGSAERFFGSAEDPRALKDVVDHLIERGEMEPMIFVGLSYYPDNEAVEERGADMELTEAFDTELLHDVLPAVEARYSTYAKGTDSKSLQASRDHRTFAGYSMGAVTTYFRMSDSMAYFHNYIAMCGSLYWSRIGRENSDPDFSAKYLIDSIENQGYGPDDFFLYAFTGDGDFSRDTVEAQIASLHNHPDFFHFGENGETANTAYLSGEGEEHSGTNASDRYLYHALPLIAKIQTK